MYSLFEMVVNNAVVAGILAIVALAITRLVRRPALAHSLWVLVLLKLVTPGIVPLRVAIPLTDNVSPEKLAQMVESSESLSSSRDFHPHLESPSYTRSEFAQDSSNGTYPHGARAMRMGTATSDGAIESSAYRWMAPRATLIVPVIVSLWLVSSLLVITVTVSRSYSFWRLLRNAKPASRAIQNETRQLADILGLVRCPQVLLLNANVSPMLWSPFARATLIFPEQLVGSLEAPMVRSLLLHELSHLKRRDHWVRVLEVVTTAFYWWYPVLWWVRRHIRVAEEQCCDAWVVSALPNHRAEYATGLIKTVGFLAQGHAALPAVASGIGGFVELEKRVRLIMTTTEARKLSGWCRLPVLMFAAVCLLALRTTEQSSVHSEQLDTSRAVDQDFGSDQHDEFSPARTDRFGDPLPQGAVMRLGTVQLRHPDCTCVAFSPDGSLLASGGRRTTWIWDPASGKRVHKIPHGAVAVAFSPDSKTLILAAGSAIRVWDLDNMAERLVLESDQEGVRGANQEDVLFSPDGSWFASADAQGVVRLWDAASGEEILVLHHGNERRRDEVCLAVSPDGKQLASSCENSIRLWNIQEGGQPLLIEKAHEREVTALAFSADGQRLYSGGHRWESVGTGSDRYLKSDSQIRVWEATTGRRLPGIASGFENERVTGLACNANSQSLVVSFFGGASRVYDGANGELLSTIELSHNSYRRHALAVSPDGGVVAIAMANSSLQMWDLQTHTQRHAVSDAHVDKVRAVAFSPNGEMAVTGSYDGTVRVWDSDTGMAVQKLAFSQRTMNLMSIATSPDGNVVAATGNYQTPPVGSVGVVKVWNSLSGELLSEVRLPECGFAMAFSPDGEQLAVGTMGRLAPFSDQDASAPSITIFEVTSGTHVLTLIGYTETVLAVRFSADGSGLTSIGQDMIAVWDLTTGNLKNSTAIEAEAAVISSDGALAALANSGRVPSVAVWRTQPARAVWAVEGINSAFGAHSLDLSRDKGLLVSGCQTNTLRISDVSTGQQLLAFDSPDAAIYAVAISPNGEQVITGMNDGTGILWDVSTAQVKHGQPRE